jgi:SAM-dependent methyltransferase
MSMGPEATMQPVARQRIRPARALFAAVVRTAPPVRPAVEKLAWRAVYEAASLGRREREAPLNYGYAELSDNGAATSENAYGRPLYAKVAGAIDLKGLDVLEIGCGRGGGTAHVFERFEPRSLIGLDLAAAAVKRARARYGRPGLRFVGGDAEQLPFANASFDAVLNVESSHCYPNTQRFFEEVSRVLRPGGHLLFADLRHTTALAPGDAKDVATLRRELEQAGLQVVEEEDITANVVHALALDTPRRRARVERTVPRFVRPHVLELMAVQGSAMYDEFDSRRQTYLRFLLQKP